MSVESRGEGGRMRRGEERGRRRGGIQSIQTIHRCFISNEGGGKGGGKGGPQLVDFSTLIDS